MVDVVLGGVFIRAAVPLGASPVGDALEVALQEVIELRGVGKLLPLVQRAAASVPTPKLNVVGLASVKYTQLICLDPKLWSLSCKFLR